MAFVATSAPTGWKLGRWTQTSGGAWQEEKLDNPKIVYQFQAVSGSGALPGSNTVRLKMKDQNTEVLLLDSSAQVFVNGSYFGEYGGQWQAAGSAAPAAAAPARGGNKGASGGSKGAAQPPPAAGRAAAPAAAPAEQQGAAFEQTLAPAQAQAPQKSAPPKRGAPPAQGGGGGAPPPQATLAPQGGGGGGFAPAVSSVPEFKPFQEAPRPTGPRKAEGLDKSDKAVAQLVDAAKSGNVAKVNELVATVDPDGTGKGGNTPLMAAVGGGHLGAVEALLGACADPTLGKGEETPLTIAFQKGKQDILKALMNASFTTMNTMVGGTIDIPDAAVRSDNQEVPENAMNELRDITAMIAKQSGKDRPASPENRGKYGNYAAMAAAVDTEDKDSELLRTEAVRLAMKSLSKTNKDGGLGDVRPASPAGAAA